MNREVIPFTTEENWLAQRAVDLTSTDAAALCNVSRWKSRYQLWNEKIRGAFVERQDNAAMRLGRHMERPIAEFIAAENGLEIEPFKNYMRMPEVRLGSSFDFVARDRSFLFEIKLVGHEAFRQGWTTTDFGLEAPVEIEAQVQQEMLLAEIPVVYIGVMSGTETYLLKREFDQAVADRLVREADEFWTGPEPSPDYSMDADFIRHLYSQANPGEEATADERTAELMRLYAEHAAEESAARDNKEQLRAEILTRIGHASKVFAPGLRLNCEERGPTEVAAHTRKGFRNFRVYETK